MENLQEQLQQKQNELKTKASAIMGSFVKQKSELAKTFLQTEKTIIRFDYEVIDNDYESILLISKSDNEYKTELKLNKKYDFNLDKYNYSYEVSSAGFINTRNFDPQDKLKVSYMKDTLYFTEYFDFDKFQTICDTKDLELKTLRPLEEQIEDLKKQIEGLKTKETEKKLLSLVSFKSDLHPRKVNWLTKGLIVKITDKKVFYKEWGKVDYLDKVRTMDKNEFIQIVLNNPNYELVFKEEK